MKDIRRLVDSAEFLANRHCKNAPVVKLMVSLLLELITDHSSEVNHSSSFACYDIIFYLPYSWVVRCMAQLSSNSFLKED